MTVNEGEENAKELMMYTQHEFFMLQELEQKARQLAPFLWISLAEEPDTAKKKRSVEF